MTKPKFQREPWKLSAIFKTALTPTATQITAIVDEYGVTDYDRGAVYLDCGGTEGISKSWQNFGVGGNTYHRILTPLFLQSARSSSSITG